MKHVHGFFGGFLPCLLLAPLFFSGCSGSKASRKPDASSPQQVAEMLAGKLASSGSFLAEYGTSNGTNAMEILLAYSQSQEYFMLKISSDEERNEDDFATVFDLSEMNSTNFVFQCFYLQGNEGHTVRISFSELLDRPDNPFGWLAFFARQVGKVSGKEVPAAQSMEMAPYVSLGLSSNELFASVSVHSTTGCVRAHWLDSATVSNALGVAELDKAYRFTYAGRHEILVDKATGMLLRDSYPNLERPGPREIVLIRQSRTDVDRPISEMIPNYDQIVFTDAVSQNQLAAQLSLAFLTEIGRGLGSVEDFDRVLSLHSAAIADQARETGNRVAMEVFAPQLPDSIAQQVLADMLKMFSNCNGNLSPEQNRELFDSFLAHMADSMADDDDNSFGDLFQDRVSDLFLEQCRLGISQVPEDAREPLRKLYDVAGPPFSDGVVKGLLSATFRRAQELHALQEPSAESVDGGAEKNVQ